MASFMFPFSNLMPKWAHKNLFAQLMSLLAVNIKRLIWNRLSSPRGFGNDIPLPPIKISHSTLVRPELTLSTNNQWNMQIRHKLTFLVTFISMRFYLDI